MEEILYLIYAYKNNKYFKFKKILLDDLLHRVESIENKDDLIRVQQELPSNVEFNNARMKINNRILKMKKKESFDVIIVTVIPNELKAFFKVFRVKQDHQWNPDIETERIKAWRLSLIQKNGNELTILLTMIGRPNQTECVNFCSYVFSRYSTKLAILGGIAAGLKTQVNLMDLVIGNITINYERIKLQTGNNLIRPDAVSISESNMDILPYFFLCEKNWISEIKEIQDPRFNEITPTHHIGVIMSGEKLIADGSLPDMQGTYHDKVRAGDQESHGFAKLCENRNINWMVFRGISDFGDGDKDSYDIGVDNITKEDFQINASISAGVAIKCFLKFIYMIKKKEQQF